MPAKGVLDKENNTFHHEMDIQKKWTNMAVRYSYLYKSRNFCDVIHD